jgi:hypothetical protein
VKRDFDLIRRILSDVEKMAPGQPLSDIAYPEEYDRATIYAHVDLLIKAGLIEAKSIKTIGSIVKFHIIGLTWAGHDFLDAARDNTIWKKAKESILKPTVSITFDLLLAWLKAEAKQKIGLP